MNIAQIDSLLLAWSALNASPSATPYNGKSKDGILGIIADYFSVDSRPLAAYLHSGAPLPKGTDKFTFRKTLCQWVDAFSSAQKESMVASGIPGSALEVSTRNFIADYLDATDVVILTRGETYFNILAAIKRPRGLPSESWLFLLSNVIVAFEGLGDEVWVAELTELPEAIDVETWTSAVSFPARIERVAEHAESGSAALVRALSAEMLGRAKALGDYRKARWDRNTTLLGGEAGNTPDSDPLPRTGTAQDAGQRLDGREGLIAAIGTMEERINENLQTQLGNGHLPAASIVGLLGISAEKAVRLTAAPHCRVHSVTEPEAGTDAE